MQAPPDNSFVGGLQGGLLLQSDGSVTGAARILDSASATAPDSLRVARSKGSAIVSGTISGQNATLTAVAGNQTFTLTGALSTNNSTLTGTYSSSDWDRRRRQPMRYRADRFIVERISGPSTYWSLPEAISTARKVAPIFGIRTSPFLAC